MKGKKTHHILLRSFLYIIVILIVPIAVMIIIHYQVIDIIQEQMYDHTLRTMQNSVATIEETMSNLPRIAYSLSTDDAIMQFLSMERLEEDGSSTIDVINAQSQVNAFAVSNIALSFIQIYSKRSGAVIDSGTTGLYIDRYYGRYFSIEGMTREDWYNDILTRELNYCVFPSKRIQFASIEKKRLMYAQALKGINIDANIYFYIDADDFLAYFSPIAYKDDGFVMISDKDGQEVLSDHLSQILLDDIDYSMLTSESGYFFQDIGDEKMFLTYIKSSFNDWNYIVAVPIQGLLQPMKQIRFTLSMLIIFAFFVSIGIVFISAYRISKPMLSIYNTITAKKPGMALTAEELSVQVVDLITNNDMVQQRLAASISVMQNASIIIFLHSTYLSDEEAFEMFRHAGIALNPGSFVVLVASIGDSSSDNGLSESSVYKALVREVLENHMSYSFIQADLDAKRIVLLLHSEDDSIAEFKERVHADVQSSLNDLSKIGNLQIQISGLTSNQLCFIPPLFEYMESETAERLDHKAGTIQWYESMNNTAYYYPISVEIRLVAAVRDGNAQDVIRLFEHLFDMNRSLFHQSESQAEAYQLIRSVYATLLRHNIQFASLEDNEILSAIKRKENVEDIFQSLQTLYLQAFIGGKDNVVKKGVIKDQLIEYVNTHYSDSQISLRSVADHYNVTDVYLSKLFKQTAGMNFAKYLEKLRIEKAEELISEKDYKISEIAALVGYNSVQTFRRSYKRYHHRDDSETEMDE